MSKPTQARRERLASRAQRQAGQHARRGRAAPAPAPASNVSPTTLSTWGMRAEAQGGRWENQAEEAAGRLLAGERGLARRLSPTAPAAPPGLTGSPGLPLPAWLRRDLETGFGADLSALRVHVDAEAAAAAASYGALGFTAGRDVYFAAGAFQPDRETGYRLLAHEVAHVLQQTGRSAGHGLVRATVTTGNALPQMLGEGKAYRVKYPSVTFDWLAAGHRKAGPSEELERLIRETGKALNKDLDNEAAAVDLEKKVLADDRTYEPKSDRARAFLFDLLKLTDRWEGADHLLDKDALTQTYAAVPALQQKQQPAGAAGGGAASGATAAGGQKTAAQAPSLAWAIGNYYTTHTQGFGWFDTVASGHIVLKQFWPNLYMDTIWRYMIGPTRAIPSLQVARKGTFRPDLGIEHLGSFADARRDFLQNWVNQRTPADNELVVTAFDILATLDGLRLQELNRITKEVDQFLGKDTPYYSTVRRRWLAVKVVEWGRAVQAKDAIPGFSKVFGKRLEDLGRRAIAFWDEVAAVRGLSFDRDFISRARKRDPKTLLRLVPDERRLTTALPTALRAAATTLFKLTKDDELPDIATYSAQVKAAGAPLAHFAQMQLELPLLRILARKNADENKAVVYAWFMAWLLDFVQFLRSYNADDDQKFVAQWGRADVRFAHRLRAAKRLRQLAAELNDPELREWKALREQSSAILQNRQQGRSRLGLLGDWKAQEGLQIAKLAEDYPRGLKELPGIPGSDIAKIYLILYYRGLSRQLDGLLRGAAAELKDPRRAIKQEPLLERAVKATDPIYRPVRYRLTPFEYAPNPNARQDFADTSGAAAQPVRLPQAEVFEYLLETHPKTRALTGQEKARGRDILYPVRPGEIFLWSVPKVTAVVSLIRSDQLGLNELLASALAYPLAVVKDLTDADWFAGLARLPNLAKLVDAAVSALLAGTRKEVDPKVRAAVSHERRLIAAVARDRLAEYTGTVTQGKLGSWDFPLQVLALIERFARWVSPDADRAPQLAALFLDLAPTLRQVFRGEKRYDIITGYYGYVVLAIDYTTAAKSDDLRRVTDPDEFVRLVKNRDDMEKLRVELDQARKATQKRFGFASTDGKTLESPNYSFPIQPNKAFQIDGVWYTLVEVYHRFEYHPAYGTKPLPGSPPGTGGYLPPLLIVDGQQWPVGPQAPDKGLFTIIIAGRKVIVTGRDEELLDSIYHVVESQAFVLAMEKLGELIDAAGQLALDAAEFIPGAGQVVAAARIVATIAQFLASGEFDEIKEALTNDPVSALKKIWDEIKERVEPAGLWDFMLFGGALFDWLMKGANLKPARKPIGGRKGSRLAKVLAKLRGIRIGVGKGLRFLYQKVQIPLHALRVIVEARPLLATAVGWIASHLYEIVDLVRRADKAIERVRDWYKQAQAGFQERLQGLIDGLAGLKLPGRVLPIAEAVAAIIDLILNRFGTKGKVVRFILDHTGAMAKVSKMIEDAIVDSAYDPNQIWRDLIAKAIEPIFVRARDYIVDLIYTVLVDWLGLPLKRPGKTKTEDVAVDQEGDGFDVSEEELATTQGYDIREPDPLAIAALPVPGPGRPLPDALRLDAELRFGHDFRHVRLHAGAEAERETSAFGAQGLTSGSHVFLRPDLSPWAGQGRRVLDHELAHVLQQTGPRPLAAARGSAGGGAPPAPGGAERSPAGRRYGTTPVRGKPGSGLRVDPAGEAAAERIASGAHDPTTGPVSAGPQMPPGWAPAGLNLRLMRRLFNELTNVQRTVEARSRIEKEVEDLRRTGKAADVPADELQIARAIWTQAWTKISELDGPLPKIPLIAGVKEPLKAYVAGQKRWISPAVDYIAQSATITKRKPRGAPKDAPPPRELHIGDFTRFLQEFIMSMTGMSMIISVRKRPAGGGEPGGGWIEKVTFTNLSMLLIPYAGNGQAIWNAAMSSFKSTPNPERRRALIRGLLRESPSSFWVRVSEESGKSDIVPIWDTAKFAFAGDFVKTILRMESYITTEEVRFANIQEYIRARMPVGKYGDANQAGPNRESHHTTQWVLIEHFRNRTAQKAFRYDFRSTWKLLGVEWDGQNRPARFVHPSKNRKVEFAALDDGARGEPMPAILLAAVTHKTGNLHVGSEKPEDLGGKEKARRPTQSAAVNGVFHNALFQGELADYRTGRTAAQFAAFVQNKNPDERAALSDQIYSAVQDTYHWMYGHMMPALERALPGIELGYYEDINGISDQSEAAIRKERPAREKAMLERYKAAESNNNKVMRQQGWIE